MGLCDYLYSWQFWMILIIIILIVMWFFSSYSIQPKEPEVDETTSMSETTVDITKIGVADDMLPVFSYTTVSSYEVPVANTRSDSTQGIVPNTSGSAHNLKEYEYMSIPTDYDPLANEKPSYARNMKVSKGEQECVNALRRIFPYHEIIHDYWPGWCINPETKAKMQVDVWLPQLDLGIEYNGEQHYHHVKFYHPTHTAFQQQVKRDNYKVNTFEKHKKKLITVPYTVAIHDIETYLRRELNRLGIPVPEKIVI